jgi:hypothetical protein
MTRFGVYCVALAAMLLAGCSAPSSAPVQGELLRPPPFCDLSVDGAAIRRADGTAVRPIGVNLPSIKTMLATGISPEQRLRQVAQAGGTVVRLPFTDEEVTPQYVPGQVLPFVAEANKLGVIVILSWRNDTEERLNKQGKHAEDFVRLVVPYLRGYKGVWLDPLYALPEAPPGKQRAVAERMLNVVRGMGDNRIVIIGNPVWLLTGDATINRPFDQGNVLYGVTDTVGLNANTLPLFVTDGAAALPTDVTGGALDPSAAIVRGMPICGA